MRDTVEPKVLYSENLISSIKGKKGRGKGLGLIVVEELTELILKKGFDLDRQ